MIRRDFVSNSSSSSFIIDTDSDPDGIIDQKTIEFADYCKTYLERDIFGRYWYDLDNQMPEFIFVSKDWFMELFNMNKQDAIFWHVLDSDRSFANEIVRKQHEYSEKYKDISFKIQENVDKYFGAQNEILNLGLKLIENISEILIPVFGNMKLHYACGSDDSQSHSQWMNDEAYYRDHIWKLNGKFTREYNEH